MLVFFVKRFYFDTIVHSKEALEFLVGTAGADRVLLGSDAADAARSRWRAFESLEHGEKLIGFIGWWTAVGSSSDSYRYTGLALLAVGSFDAALDNFRKGIAIDQRAVDADSKFLGPQRSLVLFGDHIARTFLAQGLQAEGLTKARANLVAANRLVKVDADNKAWQAYLGKLHVSIGDILLTQGQVADALTEYRTMNAIIEPLAAGRWQLDR